MITKETAIKVRKALWNGSPAFSELHEAFCEENDLTMEEVLEFLNGAVDYFDGKEEDWREAHAIRCGIVIETNSQKKDGSFVSAVSIIAPTETYARIIAARGKALTAIVYDPQEPLPLEYQDQPAPEGQEQLPMGGLLPEPVEVEAEEVDE